MFDCDFNSTLANETAANCNANWSTAAPTGPVYLDPSYYSMNYRIVGTVFQGIVFAVGVLGNIMVVIVVWQTRSMHTPTNCYLVSLSVADFMVLIASVPNEIIAYYLLGESFFYFLHCACHYSAWVRLPKILCLLRWWHKSTLLLKWVDWQYFPTVFKL